jgi:integrase
MKGSNRRRYFTEAELGKLIGAVRKGRYGQRDATLVLLMARHGLRVSEAVDLEWDQIDFTRAHLHVRRLKGGIASVRQSRAMSFAHYANCLGRPKARSCSRASVVDQ